MSQDFIEPPPHLEDTNPIRPVGDEPLPAWRRAIGFISLMIAAALTVGTALLLIIPPSSEPIAPTIPAAEATQENIVAPPPTLTPQVVQQAVIESPNMLPTISADAIAALLSSSSDTAFDSSGSIQIVRNAYNPFTIIPDRPRSEVVDYQVVEGDTIFTIAERFGLKPETIAWSNDRSIIGNLRPGRSIHILPVDGVYHQVIGSDTIAKIAAAYRIADPYIIIDSEYNNLFGVSPDTVLPSGTWIVIPGGVAEQITWTPKVEREGGEGNQSGGSFVTFAPGEPGSCGRVANVGGSFWASPMDNYQFTRGFSSWHTGVDLASSVGAPVKAANGGVVIFAGWNSWGYGNTIVLSHGPFSTLYGHLSSINVSCGQVVSTGQVIGGVGSTGNSSGPHLHFEIRYLDVPQNPAATLPF
jgi:murein DD-endopeptidase MepM/ murein hydrolase activator NlpD